jgi:hypothetical protein
MKDIGWSVIPPPAPPLLFGDYNDNGIVDAGDYVTWRKYKGTSTVLPNDAIGGTIGASQYNQWRTNFGDTAGAGSGSTTVPEPAAATLLLAGCVTIGLARRKRRG